MNPARPTIVLVLGMHRSGTSLLAGMLARLGLPLGGPLLDAVRPDAPTGYAEHAEVVDLHEPLLAWLGRVWAGPDGARPLPPDWREWPESRRTEAALRTVVQRELAGHGGLWGVKDPRLCRFLPLWRDLADGLGADLLPVLGLRHPAAVAASLAARNGMDERRATALWLRHLQEVTAAFDQPPAIFEYDDLLADPTAAATRLAAIIARGQDGASIASAAALAVRDHRHHHRSGKTMSDDAQALYEALARGMRPAPATPPPCPAVRDTRFTIVMRVTRPAFLARALRSVLGQTVSCWHLVLVNDGGPPGPVEDVVSPYRRALGARLTILHLAVRHGMEAASNLGIGRDTAPYIVIHDDDDTWRAPFLERCLDVLDGGADGVVTRTTVVREQYRDGGVHVEAEVVFRPDVTSIDRVQLEHGNLFPPIAFAFSRRAWETVGPFRSDLEVLGDWEFNRRFAERFDIAFVDEPLARWHRRPPDDRFPNTDAASHARVRTALLAEWRPPGLAADTPASASQTAVESGRLPRFLVIGAQRAGTTWLFRNLADHPRLWLPPVKEIHYFDSLFGPDAPRWADDRRRFFLHCVDAVLREAADSPRLEAARRRLQWAGRFAARDLSMPDWYAAAFADAPAGAITGDITPGYALLPDEGVACAARMLPDVQVLLLLRDPLERSLSGALHELTRATPAGFVPSLDALAAALDDPRCVARSSYRATIETWERHFPARQLHYLFFDDVRSDPLGVLRQVCSILELPFSGQDFPGAARIENASRAALAAFARPGLMQRLARRHLADLEWLAARFGAPVDGWMHGARSRLNGHG